MVGYLSEAIAEAIRTWPALKDMNVVPIRATGGTTVLENTPLPAVAVHVSGHDGRGNTFFGGGIRLYFDVELYYMLPITNYTFSRDGGHQAQMLDLSEEVIRCMEQSSVFNNIRHEHDLVLQFDRMDTETTYGTQGSTSVVVDLHKIVYNGSVAFDPKDTRFSWATVNDVSVMPDYKRK